MARINIEDSIHTDDRFIKLTIKLQSYEMALGCLVKAWMVAQKHFISSDRYIPLDVWNKQGLKNEIIEVGLATATDRYIKMAGIEKQFSWLTQRVAAGQKGGLKRAENKRKTLATASTRLADATLLPPSSVLSTQGKKNIINAQFYLESVYKRFAKKMGKTPGLKSLSKSVKTIQDFQDLEIAVDNFNAHHKATPMAYIPYFSTFANQWRDWVDPETSVSNAQADFSGIDND